VSSSTRPAQEGAAEEQQGGDPRGDDFASLGKGKYDADNAFSLVTFDPTVGDNGDWKAITPLGDITKE
jgi:hypothetical protein